MKIPFPHNKVLILAPHTDDAELGCGGTIARLIEEGKEVHVAAFSGAALSLPPGSKPNRLFEEYASSMKCLNIPPSQVHFFDYPVRIFNDHRQAILDNLITLRKTIEPDLVFIPSEHDLHQDHQILFNEGLRAFKEASIWGYELPWNTITFSSQAIVKLDRPHIEKKWEALQFYTSQLELKRQYFSWSFVESLAKVRGAKIKSEFAEAFEIKRMRF